MQGINKISGFIILWISISLVITSCRTSPALSERDFRKDMRDFVIKIADTAQVSDPSFIVIPQNGQELISLTYVVDGTLAADYIAAIDGTGREDLFYGYNGDDIATPTAENNYMREYLDRFETEGIEVLTTDYCVSTDNINDSYKQNELNSYISFGAGRRDLDVIPGSPAPYNGSDNMIASLSDASNFLYIINPEGFGSKAAFLSAVDNTNFDIIIMDAFYDGYEYSPGEILDLQTKPSGSGRLVIAYMSIGEAEDYRFYWNHAWKTGDPIWLDHENPDWAGNYKVRYWEKDWQNIILVGDDSYLGKILTAGFNGVYLDIIDGFEYFENY